MFQITSKTHNPFEPAAIRNTHVSNVMWFKTGPRFQAGVYPRPSSRDIWIRSIKTNDKSVSGVIWSLLLFATLVSTHDEYFNNMSLVSSDVAVIERLSICWSWWRILGINKPRANGLYFDFGKRVDHLLLSTWTVITSERDYGIIKSIVDVSAVTLYLLWPDHQNYIQFQFGARGGEKWH